MGGGRARGGGREKRVEREADKRKGTGRGGEGKGQRTERVEREGRKVEK